MSYKLNLSGLQRGGGESITQQLVDRIKAAIEAGELEPGAKLPPTRELAELAGVNHLTAARVYRKLAELGYVSASVGRGTFVRTLPPASSASHGDDWQVYALPPDELTYSEQVLADTFSLAGRDDVISLAIGWPAPGNYPTDALARITAEVFEEEGANALSYLPAQGLFDLREQIAARGRAFGYAEDADEVVITSGAQQAIALSAQATLEPGDVAVIESPTFIGMMTALRGTRARVIGVPVDEDGFDVDALERLLARHEVKVVGGGLRTGWVAARGPVRERIATLKLDADFHSPTLIQHIAARWLATGAYERHVKKTIPFYRERRDALLASLERHLAGEYHVDPPAGGHHLWVTLARPLDERALYSEAARHGVTFTPGGAVTAERRSQTSFRLSFSLLEPAELEEGVRRLARAIREVRRRAPTAGAAPMS